MSVRRGGVERIRMEPKRYGEGGVGAIHGEESGRNRSEERTGIGAPPAVNGWRSEMQQVVGPEGTGNAHWWRGPTGYGGCRHPEAPWAWRYEGPRGTGPPYSGWGHDWLERAGAEARNGPGYSSCLGHCNYHAHYPGEEDVLAIELLNWRRQGENRYDYEEKLRKLEAVDKAYLEQGWSKEELFVKEKEKGETRAIRQEASAAVQECRVEQGAQSVLEEEPGGGKEVIPIVELTNGEQKGSTEERRDRQMQAETERFDSVERPRQSRAGGVSEGCWSSGEDIWKVSGSQGH